MQIKGDCQQAFCQRRYWFCPLFEGSLTGTWEEKIFRVWGPCCWSDFLPKGESSRGKSPHSWCWSVAFVSPVINSLCYNQILGKVSEKHLLFGKLDQMGKGLTPLAGPNHFVKILAHYSWSMCLFCVFSKKGFSESVFSKRLARLLHLSFALCIYFLPL